MHHGRETTADQVLGEVDLTGTVAVVTGASSGIGHALAASLADHGATVVAAVRNPVAARVDHVVELDLGSLDSVRAAAAEITAVHAEVHLVFNNAGVMATPFGRTADGFELQLGTNHLGHFLLTGLLAPCLTGDARIVNTSSLGHMVSGMRWDDPHFRSTPYDKWAAYGQSKTANILFARGLAQRGWTAYAVHPGAIDTGLTRHLEGDELAFVEATTASETKSLEQGAAGLVRAATSAEIPNGSYLADCQVAEAAPHATAPDEVERLWAWSEEQVGWSFSG